MKLRHELALVLLLLVLAAPTRLLGLDVLPPGLFHDEAYEGIDAVRIASGARPIFLPENYGREPLYAYVMASMVVLQGPTATAVRATSACFGLLLIPAAYFWARVYFGSAVGLLAAALTASSYWVLHESRLGMRPIALPVFLAVSSALVWQAARRGRTWCWPLAGLSLGLSLYTYLPARLFPMVIAGQAVLGLWASRHERQKAGWRLAGPLLLFAVAAGVALPLPLYFQDNPEDAAARSNVVSIFAGERGRADPLGALWQNLWLNLGMFVWRGDDTLRHNLPFRPVFDWIIAPFFLVGVAVALRQIRLVEFLALWLWLGVMLLPGLLSDSAPHFLRSIGLLPALFVLPALGLNLALRRFHELLGQRGCSGYAALISTAAGATVLVLTQALTWRDYFRQLPNQPGLAEAFDAQRAALANQAGNPDLSFDTALPAPGWSHATMRFLRPHSFSLPGELQPVQAQFGPNVKLLGYNVQLSLAAPARLTLYWQSARELNTAYVENIRVVDSYGRVWWQYEAGPGGGTLPTDTWLPGEVISDHAIIEPQAGFPADDLQVEVALAQPNGRRLPVVDSGGRQVGTSLKLPLR